MLGHDDIGPHIKPGFLTALIDGLGEPLTCSIFTKKWLPAETRKRQGVCVTNVIEAVTSLAMTRYGVSDPTWSGSLHLKRYMLLQSQKHGTHITTIGDIQPT